jgi:hypothetical protein
MNVTEFRSGLRAWLTREAGALLREKGSTPRLVEL